MFHPPRSKANKPSHGSHSVYRYYAHSKKHDGKLKCSIKRIQAEEIEEVVVGYLEKVAVDGGYLTNIKQAIAESSGASTFHLQKELGDITLAHEKIAKDIDQVFKLQMQLDVGSTALELAKEKLEMLGRQKKQLENLRTKLLDQISSSSDLEEGFEELQTRIFDFRKGWRKASSAEQKRLLRRLLGGLVCREKGIDVFYYPAVLEGDRLDGSKVLKFKDKTKDLSAVPGDSEGSDFATKLEVANLRVDVNGDRGRTRTCDLLLRRQLLYPTELRDQYMDTLDIYRYLEEAQSSKSISKFQDR